jgi:hypothetical protein
MNQVAHHLQKEALLQTNPSDRDVFARSAYNRYYYGIFLRVREMLIEFEPQKWAEVAHANCPEILTGQIFERFRKARKRASTNQDKTLVQLLNRAMSAATDLAKLMERAKGVRVVADYYPNTTVIFDKERFSLGGITVTEAHAWNEDARMKIDTIQQVWRQIYV